MSKLDEISIYHIEPTITNLGPGKRFGIWVQGCGFKCEGCLVEDSWNIKDGISTNIESLCNNIIETKNIEGITISGGEPFEQIDAIYTLVKKIILLQKELSIIIFTGYTLTELKKRNNKKIFYILQHVDILIDGKYVQELYKPDPWRGSSNQFIHFLSQRYTIDDYKEAYKNHVSEYYIKDGMGQYFTSGIPIK